MRHARTSTFCKDSLRWEIDGRQNCGLQITAVPYLQLEDTSPYLLSKQPSGSLIGLQP